MPPALLRRGKGVGGGRNRRQEGGRQGTHGPKFVCSCWLRSARQGSGNEV